MPARLRPVSSACGHHGGPTGSTTSFTLVDLTTALHTVAPEYRDQRGAWVMSDGCLKALRQVKDTVGAPVLLNASNPGNPPMLLGYPVYVDENLPAPGANTKSCMVAGWQAAYIIRRVAGLSVLRQVELFSASGQLGYRSQHRVDGRIGIAAAGVTLAHSAT
jgi:HK97 family phage major capsid protein